MTKEGGCCDSSYENNSSQDSCHDNTTPKECTSSTPHENHNDCHEAHECKPLLTKQEESYGSTKKTKSKLRVMDLCCASEVSQINSILNSVEGVKTYSMNVTSKILYVDHDITIVSVDDIVKVLQSQGFDSTSVIKDTIDSLNNEDQEDSSSPKLQTHIMLSGVFWIASMLNYIGESWHIFKFLGLISVALGTPHIARKAYLSLLRFYFDTNCMMFFAIIGACCLKEYTEAAAVAFLFSLSDWLESISTVSARDALSELVKLRPVEANLQDPVTKKFTIVPASSIAIGSIVSVRTGDKVPCDGIVIQGKSFIDESSLTGESVPVSKADGDEVLGGTVNKGERQLLVKTTSTSDDSAVARLLRLVEEAQMNRSPTEKLVDAFVARYTPIVIIAAILMCSVPWFFSPTIGRQWTRNGLVMIVIACPCALVISTPTTYVAGLAMAASSGVVVKGGAYLESLSRVTCIAFDKTNTLTEGVFQLVQLNILTKNYPREKALKYLYAIQSHANHPLATALIQAAKNENVPFPKDYEVSDHNTLAGEGITAKVNGNVVYVGNMQLFERLGLISKISADELKLAKGWMKSGTVGFMSVGDQIVCSFCVADVIRPEAKSVLSTLQNQGIETHMLTGDNSEVALTIGRSIGIKDEYIKSQLLPEVKLELVNQLKDEEIEKHSKSSPISCKRRGLVLMCGDGVNDAPSLAAADISVAMGKGCQLAMEVANVTLLDSNLNKLLMVLDLSKRVTRTIIENVIFSVLIKTVVIVLTFSGSGSLWLAISSDVGAMLIVTANSMKLLPSKRHTDSKVTVEDA